ncbi:ABC transporter permease [Ornithinimicrobium cavernae]|uniref:ABC transporter permease n=1 Tax=Ornithinimicrobium cavernae TaxID=2666047 RepID=UPI00137AAC4F|nr:ABC transporter permease subunit [Ornithinimicrobium cavernae]
MLVLGYHLWASAGQSPFFPPVDQILEAFITTWTGEGFRTHVLPSLTNLAIGYLGGVALGIVGGVVLAQSRFVRTAVAPVIAFLLALPAVALVPLFITVVGIGPSMQRGVIAFAATLYVLVNTTDGLVKVDEGLLDMGAVFRVGPLRRIVLIQLPSIAPRLLGAGRAALSLCVLIMVVSEMVGASVGIGAVTLLAQQSFQYRTMWAGMVIVALIGVVLNALYGALERPVLARSGLDPKETSR